MQTCISRFFFGHLQKIKKTLKMYRSHYFIILMAAFLMVSCHKDYFTIEGTLTNGAGKTIYIEELTPNDPLFIDSIRLDDKGNFKYSYKMPYPSFYNLHATKSNYAMLLPEEGEHITITGDYTNLEKTYELRGSAGSILLWQLQAYSNDGSERLNEIISLDQQNQQRFGPESDAYKKAKVYTDSLYWDLYTEQSDYVKQFIRDHHGSLATLIALYKPLGRDHALINIKRDPSLLSFYDDVLDGLKESLPDNPHTIHFQNSVAHLHHLYERYQQQQNATITMGE